MAAEWDIYLGALTSQGLVSPFGRKTKIATKEVTRQDRAADGTLYVDVLYVKREITLSYAKITESAIDIFEYWYQQYLSSREPLDLYMYTDSVNYDTIKVKPVPVDKTRLVRAADNLYAGVVLKFIEV